MGIGSEIRGDAGLELEGIQLLTGDPAAAQKHMIYPVFAEIVNLEQYGSADDNPEKEDTVDDDSQNGDTADDRKRDGSGIDDPAMNAPEFCLLVAGDEDMNLDFKGNYLIIKDSAVTLPRACNMILEIFSKYNEMEKRFLELLAGDSNMQKLVNLLADFYGNAVYSIDASYNLLAINEDPELPFISQTFKRLKEHGYMPLNTILSLMESEEWKTANPDGRTIYMDIPQFYCPFLRCEYRVEHVLQAYLFVIGINTRFLPGDEELLDIWTDYIRLFFSRHLEQVSFSGFYHEHFFHDIMDGTLTYNQQIQEQLHPIGWHLNDLYCILFISADQITNGSLRGILFQRLAYLKEGKPLYYHDDLYCVFHLDQVTDAADLKKELSILLRQIGVKAGLSEPYRGFKRMKEFSGQAMHALEAGKRLPAQAGKYTLPDDEQYMASERGRYNPPQQFLFAYEDYVIPYLFQMINTLPETGSFIHESIRFLDNYDKEHHTDYLRTLRVYLRQERNLVKTAKELYIHRNTLVYRVQQISQMTNLDLDQWITRLRIQLSIESYLMEKG